MQKDAIEKIVELSPANLKEVGECIYSDKRLFLIDRPVPETLVVFSLAALEEYVLTQEPASKYIIHVHGPGRVDVLSQLSVDYRQRESLLSAQRIYDSFSFGVWHSVEEFVINLQSMFVQDESTAKILNLVGNITTEAKQIVDDDGVTQRVTAKAGLARVEEREVPNPVVLRPYRTFPEVEQPESKFVLRVDAKGPSCALFEADGGAWKIEAVSSIAGRLNESLSGPVESGNIIILA